MGAPRDDADPPTGEWPGAVPADGVTESIVATLGPNDRWNLAALGLQTGEAAAGVDDGDPGTDPGGDRPADDTGPVTARTWGRTRTRGNFERQGGGVVQFVDDPVTFVEAALGIVEREDPVHPAAAAHVSVDAERLAAGEAGDTEWVDWRLRPRETVVRRRSIPTIRRGFAAAIEATVHASRLDVPAYDEAELLDRLDFLAGVVDTAGGERERRAFERIDDRTDWRERR